MTTNEVIKAQAEKVHNLTAETLINTKRAINELQPGYDHHKIVALGYIEALQNAIIDLKISVRRIEQ